MSCPNPEQFDIEDIIREFSDTPPAQEAQEGMEALPEEAPEEPAA